MFFLVHYLLGFQFLVVFFLSPLFFVFSVSSSFVLSSSLPFQVSVFSTFFLFLRTTFFFLVVSSVLFLVFLFSFVSSFFSLLLFGA